MKSLLVDINGNGFTCQFPTEQDLAGFFGRLSHLIALHGSDKAMAGMIEAFKIKERMVLQQPNSQLHLGK